MKGKLLQVCAALLVIIASVVTSSATFFWMYQPKIPKALRK